MLLDPGKDWVPNNRQPGKWSRETWARYYQILLIATSGGCSSNPLDTGQSKWSIPDQAQAGDISKLHEDVPQHISDVFVKLMTMALYDESFPMTTWWRQKKPESWFTICCFFTSCYADLNWKWTATSIWPHLDLALKDSSEGESSTLEVWAVHWIIPFAGMEKYLKVMTDTDLWVLLKGMDAWSSARKKKD